MVRFVKTTTKKEKSIKPSRLIRSINSIHMTTAFEHDIGKHCSVSTCHQLDFLPTKCDFCRLFHCAEHATAPAHQCAPHAAMLELNRTRSAQAHAQQAQAKTPILPKICTVEGCRAKGELAALSATKCKRCAAALCVDHRFDCACRKKGALSRQNVAEQKRALLLDAATRRAQAQTPIETR
jgi:hypothetical protein